MNTFRTCTILSASALLLAWSEPSVAEEPASFRLASKDLGFPVIDTTVTFTRLAKHAYRVQYSTPPAGPEYLMLYTGFYFCAARQLALDSGFDRTALVPDPESPQGAGIAVFLEPGEEGPKVLEPRFAEAKFSSIELFARNCPTQVSPVKH